MEYAFWVLAGTLYGFLFGLIPVAGATVALLSVFGFISWFSHDPYLLVIFTTAVVASSTIGDSFSSIIMNIPGAGGSAASMVDGFPLSKQGFGAKALSAALHTSVVNGIVWGMLVFLLLPYYAKAIMYFGIPETLLFILFAFTSICFISNRYWFRGILSLLIGIFLGLIGQNPISGAERFTFGWEYLGGGAQMAPILAGVLAFPELYEAYVNRKNTERNNSIQDVTSQIIQGAIDSWKFKWDGLRGGFVGAIIGIVPGIGGAIADWIAYGQTVAFNKKEKIEFGSGNIKGVIGCEGANNAQKATSYVPTVLFGIPGAPFEVVILALFMIVGIELGSPGLLTDFTFFKTLSIGYFWGLLLSFIIGIVFIKYAVKITNLPFSYYFWPIIILLVWSSVQYTGYWEDYIIFVICCVAGIVLKKIKFSRAALLIGFVLSEKLEKTLIQFNSLYSISDLVNSNISLVLLALIIVAIIYGIFFNKQRINYI